VGDSPVDTAQTSEVSEDPYGSAILNEEMKEEDKQNQEDAESQGSVPGTAERMDTSNQQSDRTLL
jgi:hypothetical protein